MIHTEEMFVEGKTKLIAVLEWRDPESGAWKEWGQVGGLTESTFQKGAQAHLGLYRKARPNEPTENSRIVRRTITVFDEPMAW